MNKQVFNTNLSFPEARVLMAISHETTPMNVSHQLNLDASYTSRVIKKLTNLKYVQKIQSTIDARSKNISLTESGKQLLSIIDSDSNDQIQNLISNLTKSQQKDLYKAFETINNILFKDDGE
ncbi:MarR family winged helix-turn-helix transcriptional regulator [Companilactobacillus allii]|nr:MarR family winged helix-turn-helix transcriptional regulator [Companilactobacillus allii]USQ67627.1 MarR family winged helix-turn-helix transcriptional regulator [Companilactobacillus allii]